MSLTLPQAHDGCTCECHRQPNILHCVPCCYPKLHRCAQCEGLVDEGVQFCEPCVKKAEADGINIGLASYMKHLGFN